MDDGESQSFLGGNVNRRLIFSSQLSQGVENSQIATSLQNENSIDKSLDVRLLSQMDYFTPAYNDDSASQLFEPTKDSADVSGIFGETPQKVAKSGSRAIFKRKIGFDGPQTERKKYCPMPTQQLTVASLPLPRNNPYLHLPNEIEHYLNTLLQKPDFKVLDQNRLSRYQKDFKELQILGKGNTSTVTLCKHRIDGCYYAIKQIYLSNTSQKQSIERKARKEVQLLATLCDAPHICHYCGCWEEDETFYIQLEYSFFGSITKYREKSEYKEGDVAMMIWQIANALKYLHQRDLAHLDVKPENILIYNKDPWEFKLNDFGLTCDIEKETVNEGDTRYLPPEIITTNTAKAADVYALGVSAIELLTPIGAVKEKSFYSSIREGKYPKACTASVFIRPLLEGMIQRSFNQRLTIEQVVNHTYFKSFRK